MPNSCSTPVERIYGVCGFPLTQSLSPMLHTWALAQCDVPAIYVKWETPPDGLPAFTRDMRETPYAGASVTIPHKETVIPLLDGITQTARIVGAVNTLFWDGDKLLGHNTDMEGFLAPLAGRPVPETALVLGAGGAARAILAGLAAVGVPHARIAARNRDKAERLAAVFAPSFATVTPVDWERRADLPDSRYGLWVVNTTPLGMRGKTEGESPLPVEAFLPVALPEQCLAYDIVYNPLRTAFLEAAATAGWSCRDGLDMFIAQADAQFYLWTGLHMPPMQARALLAKHLAA